MSARRFALAAVAAGSVALAAPAASQATECANADVAPQSGNLGDVRTAVLCLVNEERQARGLVPLRGQAQLARSAAAHAHDMVERRYFAHVTPGGRHLASRVADAGYLPRRGGGWLLGETLAWGTGSLSTPAGVVGAWLDSPGHRHVVLSRKYRDAGIGVALGNPRGGEEGATVALNVGRRTSASSSRRARSSQRR